MNRLVVLVAALATLNLLVSSASAGHGRRVVRAHVHHHRHAHVVHRAPVVHHGRAVVRVAPVHQSYYAPRVYHVPHGHHHSAFGYPAYGVSTHYGYAPARIHVGGPVISLRIGF